MRFNIVLVQPEGCPSYSHNQCFLEVAHVLRYGLEDLGHQVIFGKGLEKEGYNVILGYHLLGGKRLPEGFKYIVYQLEQLTNPEGWPPEIINTLKSSCIVWDFSEQNMEWLAKHGINAIYKPIGFHPKMARIQPCQKKEIDILFYGSLNARREKILTQLQKKFKTKILFGVYGEERDYWISRAKLVLLIHYYETKLFDEVRLSYLMNNGIFTIVENTPYKKYEDLLIFTDYEKLVDICDYYLKNKTLRNKIAERIFKGFSHYPETEFLGKALTLMYSFST